MTATAQAIAAVRAIKHQREWGPYATRRFLELRGACHHFIVAARFESVRGYAITKVKEMKQ